MTLSGRKSEFEGRPREVAELRAAPHNVPVHPRRIVMPAGEPCMARLGPRRNWHPIPTRHSRNIGSLEEVDGDGDLDLVAQFPTANLELTKADEVATLEGFALDGARETAREFGVTIH